MSENEKKLDADKTGQPESEELNLDDVAGVTGGAMRRTPRGSMREKIVFTERTEITEHMEENI